MEDISKSIMEGNLLLASAAVFRSLHDQNLDQRDILAKFITASVHLNNLKIFDSRKIAVAMTADFGFDIPEAVIRSCIRKKLKSSFEPTGVARNQFQITQNFVAPSELEGKFKDAQRTQELLTHKLIAYVEGTVGRQLQQSERDVLVRDFYEHVKGNTRPGINATHIGLFIIGLKEQSELDVLEQAKQGLVIYEGLRYNSEGANASLNNDLYIYLDTEILFSAAGLHGQMRKDFFLDFYNLAKDLSRKSTKKSPGKIKFRYFDDTKLEVEKYFWSARAIVEGRERLNPSRDAMVNIVSGCRSKSDVTDREQSFWMSLERLGIEKDNERGYLAEHAFNIESVDSRSYLAGEMGCDQDLAGSILSKFSRINYLRKGHSDPPVESVGAIFLSGKNLMRQASFMADFYFKRDRFVPYSTDLDFITTWLWSKLGRAFGQNHVTPIAFSVVNRTRIVLSSQLGARISDEYDRLKAEIADESVGETRKEEIARALARLKSIKVLPEDIGGDNAELAFLFEDDLVARAAEEHLSLIERVEYAKKVELDRAKEQEENKKLQEEFAALYRQSVQDKAELLRIEKVDARRARRDILAPDFKGIVRLTLIVRLLYWTVPSVLSACLLFKLVSPADTPIGILGTALGALIPTFGLLSACKSKLNSVCLKIKWRGVRSWRPRRRHEPTLQEARDDTSA